MTRPPPPPRAPVREREVLYFAGFDPRGSRGYHQLYRAQAALQAGVGGLAVQVGPRQRAASGFEDWELRADTPSGEVLAHYRFMGWDDIVRLHWSRGGWRLLMDSLRANAFQAWHGGMWRMLQDRWPLVLATMMPLLLLALFLLAVALGLASGWAALQGGRQVWPVAAVGLLAAVLAVAYVRHLAQRFAPGWLTRSYAFNMRWVQGEIPEIEPRIQQHAQALLAASERLRGRDDAELLIVAHSSGTILAIAALAQALRWQPELASRVQVSLLTLGQCIPIFGALPQTKAFQEDLRAVAAATGVDWLDFSAPTDGCCFALSDPLPTCGIKRPLAGESQRMRPRLLSPRFAEMFDPPAYKTLRRDKHRMHLQYLMASERLADYDYFQITAGDRRLAERFAAQPDGGDYAGLRLRLGRRATGF